MRDEQLVLPARRLLAHIKADNATRYLQTSVLLAVGEKNPLSRDYSISKVMSLLARVWN